jgi:hypothetical protein
MLYRKLLKILNVIFNFIYNIQNNLSFITYMRIKYSKFIYNNIYWSCFYYATIAINKLY